MAKSKSAPKDDKLLEEAREIFEECFEAEAENRKRWEEDVDFAVMNNQWPEKVRRQRELDARPCLTIPRLGSFIDQVVNDARQNKPGITVHPVDDAADPETAQIISGIIRNIEVSSDAEVAYDTALEHATSGGFGYFRINTAYSSDDTFDQDIVVKRIANPLSVVSDCYSEEADSSDWDNCFVVNKMAKRRFEAKYKGADPVDWDDFAGLKGTEWFDGDDVMVAEWWKREEAPRKIILLSSGEIVALDVYEKNKALYDALGITVEGSPREVRSHKVTQRVMTGVEVLEEVAWAGRYIPIIPVYGKEINFRGERHFRSLIHPAKDEQMRVNFHTTTATELVALAPKAPYIGPKGAFKTDAAKWATINSQNHAFVEYDIVGNGLPPQRQGLSEMPVAEMQMALQASDNIKAILGMYNASLGQQGNETSGRAILARQQEGDTATFHHIDNLTRAIRHAGRVIIDLIPSALSAPRILRAIGPDGKPFHVAAAPAGMMENGQPPEVLAKAMRAKGLTKVYDLSVGKYDLVVRAGPSFNTRREQIVAALTELIRSLPAAAPLVADILAESLDMPRSEEIAERFKSLLPPGVKGQDPALMQAQEVIQKLTQQMQQLGEEYKKLEADKAAEARKLDLEAINAEAKRAYDERKLEIDGYNAETNRIKALNTKETPLNPEALRALVSEMVAEARASPDILPGEAGETPEAVALSEAVVAPAGDGGGGDDEPPEAGLAEPEEPNE